jgi:inosose dehydratase
MTDRKPSAAPGDAVPAERLAGAPISWGVCEVPGWGVQLPARDVLAEMRTVGLQATEAGAERFLPDDGVELARLLAEYDLALVGGFVPVVLHEQSALDDTLPRVQAQARRFARAGGSVLVSAVVTDAAWSPRPSLSRDDWRRITDGLARLDEICTDEGIAHVLHPHVGTLVESRDDVGRVLDDSDVRLCLDTGHFRIGGVDSVALACEAPRRVGHVHLKDVRDSVADELRAGRVDLRGATERGLFVPLGAGDAGVADVLQALEDGAYAGWYVLEQDTVVDPLGVAATATEEIRRSIDFLRGFRAGRDLAAREAGREVTRSEA